MNNNYTEREFSNIENQNMSPKKKESLAKDLFNKVFSKILIVVIIIAIIYGGYIFVDSNQLPDTNILSTAFVIDDTSTFMSLNDLEKESEYVYKIKKITHPYKKGFLGMASKSNDLLYEDAKVFIMNNNKKYAYVLILSENDYKDGVIVNEDLSKFVEEVKEENKDNNDYVYFETSEKYEEIKPEDVVDSEEDNKGVSIEDEKEELSGAQEVTEVDNTEYNVEPDDLDIDSASDAMSEDETYDTSGLNYNIAVVDESEEDREE